MQLTTCKTCKHYDIDESLCNWVGEILTDAEKTKECGVHDKMPKVLKDTKRLDARKRYKRHIHLPLRTFKCNRRGG